MKLIHLSDLHLGKRVNDFPMLEDQVYILNQIFDIIEAERPDAVLVAGDIYDKSMPSAEAVNLFDDFLSRLAQGHYAVFAISGNHDSPERIAFGGRIMDGAGIHLSPVYNGKITPVTLTDEFGPVDFYLLPFLKPVHARRAFPDETIESYTDAVAAALRQADPDFSHRTVLLTHQFVTGASRSESEELSVGGTDNVDVSVFDGFDYVALGHIHNPQNVGRETVRYCGTPLKYSFSEARHTKSVTVVEMGEKGDVSVRTVDLTPLRDMTELRGTYEELSAKPFYDTVRKDNYIRVTLTDEEDVPDALGKLRIIYPNLMRLDYDNRRTRSQDILDADEDADRRSPLELFADLYETQNGAPLDEEAAEYMKTLIEAVWEEQP